MSAAQGLWLRRVCISGLGTGFIPFASGTWGSLAAVALYAGLWYAVAALAGTRAGLEAVTAGGVVMFSIISIAWGPWALSAYGPDPAEFTLDEFAGQWVALLVLPVGLGAPLIVVAAALAGQFCLFRIFDIVKPPPARQLERWPAGWGVLCDDLAAGLYANLVGQLAWRCTPLPGWLTPGS